MIWKYENSAIQRKKFFIFSKLWCVQYFYVFSYVGYFTPFLSSTCANMCLLARTFLWAGSKGCGPPSPQLNSLQSCCCLDCIRDVHSIEHYLMQLRAAAVVIKRNSYQFKFGPGHMNNVWDLLIWEAYTLTFWYGWPMPTWYWDKQLQAASGQLLPCLLLVMSPRRKK
jgi:hypothetical protein